MKLNYFVTHIVQITSNSQIANMPRQNNSHSIFLFLFPFIIAALIKRSMICRNNVECVEQNKKYTRRINDTADQTKVDAKLKPKLVPKVVDNFMKMEEWNTIIPDAKINDFDHKSFTEADVERRMPLNKDPHWIHFLIHN